MHDADPVADPLGLGQLVGVEQDRPLLLLQLEEEVADGLGALRVKVRRGLVEEEHRRVVDQRAGDGQPLLHPLGERPHPVVPAVPQVEHGEQPLRAHGARAGGDLVEPAVEVQGPGGAQVRVEPGFLWHQADEAPELPGGGRVADAAARHPGLAACLADEPGEHPDGGGLARAVRPEQPEDFAFRDGERQPVDRRDVTELAGEVLDLDHVRLLFL